MPNRNRRARVARPIHPRNPVWSPLLALFVAGGLFFGYLFYTSVRDIVAYVDLPLLDRVPASLIARGASLASGLVEPEPLRRRVNVLVLGIDRRPDEPGPYRSDTMILFSVDPISHTASMLSIPRDLWVLLPGYDVKERINAAHAYGDGNDYPGGGPAYAKKAVQYNLGVPVDYYVRLDFDGFVRLVDAIGGIDVDVPYEIVDDRYPTPDKRTERLYIPAGLQHMDGELALKYARTRHGSSDIDRGRRQQQVIMAVRDKVLGLKLPLARIPEQLRILGDAVDTDMTLPELLALAQAVRQVPGENVRSAVIDETMTIPWRTPLGWDVLLPRTDRIRDLVNDLFPLAGP